MNIQQTKFSNVLDVLYTMIKWDLFLDCKDDSVY